MFGSFFFFFFFFFYINDIVNDIDTNVRLFADHTSLYLIVPSLVNAAHGVDADLFETCGPASGLSH